jgi:hypothetical protein
LKKEIEKYNKMLIKIKEESKKATKQKNDV